MKALGEIKSTYLKDSATAFKVNMERGMFFAMLPTELVFQSINNARMSANAIFKVHKIGAMTLREQMDIPASADVLLEFQKECGENERIAPAISNSLRIEIGVGNVIEFLRTNKHMQASMDAMFTSIVLESWLFFEALCSDLWVAAVDNGGPVITSRLTMNQKWEKGEMLASSTTEIQSNAKTHPGSFRRETGMVSFQKLRSIKFYFAIAFGNEVEKIFEQTTNGYLVALNDVRNCIAHSAGKIDG